MNLIKNMWRHSFFAQFDLKRKMLLCQVFIVIFILPKDLLIRNCQLTELKFTITFSTLQVQILQFFLLKIFTSLSYQYIVFKPRGGGKWGPHGAPTPHSPRGGGLSLKKPRGGGFDQKKPRGFMGDLCHFYNFLRPFFIESQKK